MGFADFLATVHSGQTGGRVGEYFGGKNLSNQGYEAFKAQLPAIHDAFDKATTRQEIEQAGRVFTDAWTNAGGPMDERYDKFSERLVKPALNRVRQADLEGIRRDYGPQTTPITPQVAPEMQGQPLSPQTTFAPQTTPARPPDADWAARMFQATGAQPQHLENIFKTPSAIEENLAKAGIEKQKVKTLEGLSDQPTPGGTSPRAIAQFPSLAQLEPVRERPADPLQEKRGEVMDAQIRNLNRLANQPPGGVQRLRQYHIDAGDRTEVYDTDTNQLIRTIPKAPAPTSETTTETPPSGFNLEATLSGIAKDAYAQGITTPEGIKEFAKSRNVILEGEPKIEGGGMFGGNARLTGVTGVSGRPKVVTKNPPKPSQAPTGQPPPSAKATGGAPAAPKPGTVIQGYRFKGGDPANQANWEQVR